MNTIASINRRSAILYRTNEYILFLPLLIWGILYVIMLNEGGTYGDESRYVKYAYKLTQGYYAGPQEGDFLMSGPGFPMMLFPFALLDLPKVFWAMANAFLFYFSCIFFFRTLTFYLNRKQAVIATFIFYLLLAYFHRWELKLIYTESLTLWLTSLVSYTICKTFRKDQIRIKDMILPGIIIGYLTLTKVVFGPVLYASILLPAIGYLIFRRKFLLQCSGIALIAFLFAGTYLIYTYSLTGKVLYWSSWGGDAIYWMTAPYDNEYGSWINTEWDDPVMLANHGEFFKKLENLHGVEKDAAFKEEALKNLKEQPSYFIKNIFANIERLLFGFPNSHTLQKPMFMFIPNLFIVVLSVLMLIPTFLSMNRIPKELLILMVFWLFYMGITSLVGANFRQFYVMIPILGVWLSYMLLRFVNIDWKLESNQ